MNRAEAFAEEFTEKQKKALIFHRVKLLTGSIDMKSQSLAQFPWGLIQQKQENCSIQFEILHRVEETHAKNVNGRSQSLGRGQIIKN